MDHQKLYVTIVLSLVLLAAAQQPCTTAPMIQLVVGNCSIPGITAYGIQIGVGDQGQAQTCGALSTVVNSMLLMSREVCEGDGLKNPNITQAQCWSRRGGPINRNDFSAFDADGDIDELTKLNPSWATLMTLEGRQPFTHALRAPLQLGGRNITLLEGLVTQGQNHSLPHLGLGNSSALLDGLVAKKLIGAKSWGFNAGSQSLVSPREGSVVLGGYDANSFEGNLETFAFNRGERPVKRRQCPLQVAATDLTIRMNLNGTELAPLRYNDSTVTSGFCIEPYDSHLRLSKNKVNDIVTASGIRLVDRTDYPGLYNMEEGLVFASSYRLNMTIEITLENKFTVTIPSHELVNPLRGLDSQGKLAMLPEYTEVSIFRSEPLEDSAVLGKAFLSQVYLFVDWEKERFSLAKQKQRSDIAPIPTSSREECPDPSPEQRTANSPSIGLIVGMSVLGVAVLVLLALGILGYKTLRGTLDRLGGPGPGPAPGPSSTIRARTPTPTGNSWRNPNGDQPVGVNNVQLLSAQARV